METLSIISWSCLAALCVFVLSLPCPSVNALTTIACANDTSCTETNTECVNKTCACKSDFKVNGSVCSPKGLGDSCGDIANCQNVTNAICGSSKTCGCKESFKKTGNTCTKKVLNDTCAKDAECANVKNATCDSNTKKCTCTGGFKVNGASCEKKGLGDSCSSDTECTGVKQAHCDTKNKECSCSDGFKIASNGCIAKVIGSPCTSTNKGTECSTAALNTDCISGHCACLNKSYAEENDKCKKAAGETCTQRQDCLLNAVCNKTCSCSIGHVAENGLCLVPVDEACAKTTDCVSNAECAAKKCKCLSGFDALKGLCSKHKSSANSLNWTMNLMLVWFLTILFWRII